MHSGHMHLTPSILQMLASENGMKLGANCHTCNMNI